MKESFFPPEVAGTINREASFEEQFKDQHTIEHFGAPLKYVDLQPEHQKFEMPLFIAPGWAETPTAMKDGIEGFFDAGRRVLSVEHARTIPKISDENDQYFMQPLSVEEKAKLAEYDFEAQGGIPAPEIIKAKAILAVMDTQKLEKIDAVAHSEGAINTLIAAALEPERFRFIILTGPAGITDRGSDSMLNRVIGAARGVVQDTIQSAKDPEAKPILNRATSEVLKYIAKNPSAALEEVGAIVSINIENLIKKLSEKGILISIISGDEDKTFPMSEMQKMAERDEVHEFYPRKGQTHHNVYFKDTSMFIEKVLESMESKAEIDLPKAEDSEVEPIQ